MNSEDNILQRIREILGSNADNFSILEHQVDVKVQMEYFEQSKNQDQSFNKEVALNQENLLYSSEVDDVKKKSLLVGLASIEKPEAYRILERYSTNSSLELKDWALLALQESRMLLETKLLDQQQIFISTGLGGKGGKLRYFVVVFPLEGETFTQRQKELVKSEFEFSLRRFHSEIEVVDIFNHYISFIALVPLSVHVKQPFQQAINECNTLGTFIQQGFIITNVKVLTQNEISDIVNNPSSGFEPE